MNAVRVYIATTGGAAQVLRLGKEQPRMPGEGHEIFSCVYLSDPWDRLPISDAYRDFVRRPTGIIERMFGHPVFVMELSQRIVDGRSWMLGTFAAHALLHEGRLAQEDDVPQEAIWLTGSMGRDERLRVESVEHLAQKLESSKSLFQRLQEEGMCTRIFVPKTDLERLDVDWLARWRMDSGLGEEKLPIVPVETGYELIEPLELTSLARPGDRREHVDSAAVESADSKTGVPGGRAVPVVVLLMVAILLGVGYVNGFVGPDDSLRDPQTGPVKQSSADAASRWPEGQTTATPAPAGRDQVRFEVNAFFGSGGRSIACDPGAPSVAVTPVHETGGGFEATNLRTLCFMEYTLHNMGLATLYVSFQAAALSQAAISQAPGVRVEPVYSALRPGASVSLRRRLKSFGGATEMQLIAAFSNAPASNALELLPRADQAGKTDWEELTKKFETLGLTVAIARHRIQKSADASRFQ